MALSETLYFPLSLSGVTLSMKAYQSLCADEIRSYRLFRKFTHRYQIQADTRVFWTCYARCRAREELQSMLYYRVTRDASWSRKDRERT